VDRVSIERMCAGKEFQVDGAHTENAREEKLLVGLCLYTDTFVFLLAQCGGSAVQVLLLCRSSVCLPQVGVPS